MKRRHLICSLVLTMAMLTATPVFGATPHAYNGGNVAGVNTSYVTINMNDKSVKPVVLLAGGNMCSADSVANMAKNNHAFAAINGTYFSAYDGKPVPYGTLIKDGKLIHALDSGAVAGITADGRLLVDRLKFDFEGYINGEHKATPWRINHPSKEADAITIYTPEYGIPVNVMAGGKAVLVANGKATSIATKDFYVPSGGFAILYNAQVAHLVDERYKVGDKVSWKAVITTQYTTPEQWDNVTAAIGAGPSLIINGQVTANGGAEGFTEAKINTNSAGRSFIGATAEGKIIMGTMKSATLKTAAAACQQLGLVNAMCLDGGGSVGLYYNGSVKTAGRAVNNALGFMISSGNAKGAVQTVTVDSISKSMQAYNIGGNNYFKLRDVAAVISGSGKQFEVGYDNAAKSILLTTGKAYTPIGGELSGKDASLLNAPKGAGKILVNGQEKRLDCYTIGGANYFKLRDLGALFDFGVNWNNESKIIEIHTDASYQ